jgi:hypothetical protein
MPALLSFNLTRTESPHIHVKRFNKQQQEEEGSTCTANGVPPKEQQQQQVYDDSSSTSTLSSCDKKCVTFSTEAEEIEYVHFKNLTEEEIDAAWWSIPETNDIKRGLQALVKRIDGQRLEHDTDDVCLRGMEYRTKLGKERRNFHIMGVLNAVLDEQDHQDKICIYDDIAMAHLSRMFSRQSVAEAHQRALQDALDVLNDMEN